ncbi:MAG TPA: alpha/beta hydrolase [Gemmatimonadales bacterium]|nr:alpha/beta hydrolase [Gemmatimonadales bacterium]
MQHPYVVVAPAETVHVEAWAGTGRPVAVIPGLFGASFAFRKVMPLLAASGYRPIVIEPLGTGSSSRPEKADYSLAAQSHRIADVLDSLHEGPVLILAHSLGASLAFRIAIDRPDLVTGIVSLEGGPTEEATTPVFRHAMRYVPWVKVFGGINLIRRKIHGMLLDSSGDRSWVTEGVVVAYTIGEARNLDATLKAFLAMSRAKEPARLEPRLPNVACPVTLMVGTARHDGDVPPQEVALMSRMIRSFAVDSQRGAGHYLQEERPQAVANAVEQLAQRAQRASR